MSAVLASKLRLHAVWEPTSGGWYCYDDNTYDGAPDSRSPCGFGKTKAEALNDLLEKLDEHV